MSLIDGLLGNGVVWHVHRDANLTDLSWKKPLLPVLVHFHVKWIKLNSLLL